MEKRGQAAMEFLMTYGWAILAAVIAIGVLAYFGVFSPGKYTTGTFIVTAPWYGNAYNINISHMQLEIKNNGGETLTVQRVELNSATVNGQTAASCTADTTGGIINASQNYAAILTGCTGLTANGNLKGDIVVQYRRGDSTIVSQSTGTIAGKVA